MLEDRGAHTMASYALAGLLHRTRTTPDAALKWLAALTHLAGPLPSRALWLRTSATLASQRARRRDMRLHTAENRAYLRWVDLSYQMLAARDPHLRLLDTDDHSPATVHSLVHYALNLPAPTCPHQPGTAS